MSVKGFDAILHEDYLISRKLSDNCIIAILADGMGGYSHGDLAAQIVVNTIDQVIEERIGELPPIDLLSLYCWRIFR